MIRIKPVVTKPSKTVQKKRPKSINQQNIKPAGFNTRGYFDPSQPFNEDYLKVKQQVFDKYRNKKEQYVMLDVKNINRGAYIQRGLLAPLKTVNLDGNEEKQNQLDTTSHCLLKTYLFRKEKKELQEQERFLDVPKLNCDQISLRTTPLTARTMASRQISSRISTYSVLKIDADM